MARTKDEILTALIALKDADPILSAILTSSSKAAFYYNLFVLVSEFGGDFELGFDAFVETMDALLESKQVQNNQWWIRISLEFQYGDSLTIDDNGNLSYAVEDTDVQIVQRAAIISDSAGSVTLKVAGLDVDDITPIPLDVTEQAAFESYIADIGPSGINVTVVSVAGDELRIALAVDVDTQIIDPDDGTLLSDGTTKPVEAAIYAYLAAFSTQAGFDGVFYANSMLSDILAATGVVNATFTTLTKKGANEGGFTDVLALSGKKFTTFSGYVKIEAAWDLSANIVYTGV